MKKNSLIIMVAIATFTLCIFIINKNTMYLSLREYEDLNNQLKEVQYLKDELQKKRTLFQN